MKEAFAPLNGSCRRSGRAHRSVSDSRARCPMAQLRPFATGSLPGAAGFSQKTRSPPDVRVLLQRYAGAG